MASDAHRQLELLCGTWKGLETVYPSPWDPDGGPATATVHARLTLDGHFVLTEYAEDRRTCSRSIARPIATSSGRS